jgi:hypothetical protein
MARSLAGGDYRLLMAVESASRADSWYRICVDVRSQALSCDCVAWIKQAAPPERRICKHTALASRLIADAGPGPLTTAPSQMDEQHPLIRTTREQWHGLTGRWRLEERDTVIQRDPYHIVLLGLTAANGMSASGVAAFANRHRPTTQSMIPGVAGWAGYAIAAGIARQAGYNLVGQPPDHFRVDRGGRRRVDPNRVGLSDILRVGERPDLGDGLKPQQRAEQTLRLFLGPLFDQLAAQGFLDVSSALYPDRVYRLRRDPQRLRDRRVRVFEQGRYTKDLCIIRAQSCPADDGWLSTFLRLLSDEAGILQVVKQHNVFPPYSDDRERETLPAFWQPRAAAQAA